MVEDLIHISHGYSESLANTLRASRLKPLADSENRGMVAKWLRVLKDG